MYDYIEVRIIQMWTHMSYSVSQVNDSVDLIILHVSEERRRMYKWEWENKRIWCKTAFFVLEHLPLVYYTGST